MLSQVPGVQLSPEAKSYPNAVIWRSYWQSRGKMASKIKQSMPASKSRGVGRPECWQRGGKVSMCIWYLCCRDTMLVEKSVKFTFEPFHRAELVIPRWRTHNHRKGELGWIYRELDTSTTHAVRRETLVWAHTCWTKSSIYSNPFRAQTRTHSKHTILNMHTNHNNNPNQKWQFISKQPKLDSAHQTKSAIIKLISGVTCR